MGEGEGQMFDNENLAVPALLSFPRLKGRGGRVQKRARLRVQPRLEGQRLVLVMRVNELPCSPHLLAHLANSCIKYLGSQK